MIAVSHKAGQVTNVSVPDSSAVKTGSIILTLDSIEEDLRLARLAVMEEIRAVLAAGLSDPVLSINRGIAQLVVDSATQLEQGAANIVKLDNDARLKGVLQSSLTAAQYNASSYSSMAQTQKATLQQQLFELRLTESNSINELIQSHLQVEIQSATALKARATFTALINGTVHLNVVQGAFVNKGQVLFEIV